MPEADGRRRLGSRGPDLFKILSIVERPQYLEIDLQTEPGRQLIEALGPLKLEPKLLVAAPTFQKPFDPRQLIELGGGETGPDLGKMKNGSDPRLQGA